MQTLREFFASSSGLAPARQGLGLGWLISALTGVAILLGAKEAEAGECGNHFDECSWDADCAAQDEGQTPIWCCTFEQDAECNFKEIGCSCVA